MSFDVLILSEIFIIFRELRVTAPVSFYDFIKS
jgi:hypothetical protein